MGSKDFSPTSRVDLPWAGVRTQAIGLVAAVAVCFGAAGIGAAVTTPQIPTWYAELNKPSWNPPAWVFGPVWSALYLMMGIAAWLVWRERGIEKAKGALSLFAVQLALNTLWSVLFFGWQNPQAAAIEIIVLWIAIAATIMAFWKHSRVAASLLVPYLLWVSFAAVLNWTIWWMNR
jgi:tryptophan-rich sensory protein